MERWEPWLAAVSSLLVHALFLLLLLFSSKPTVTPPQGAGSSGRTRVDFVGQPSQPAPPPPSPAPSPVPRPQRQPPAASPVRSTLVEQAEAPVPPQAEQASVAPPSPPEQAAAPASTAPVPRYPQRWTGRPPGMLEEEVPSQEEGNGRSVGQERGDRSDTPSAQPSMEVGGYQVYYDLRSETLLRAWKAQGMQELSVPLPGTQLRMVCPLEIALRRGSGKCRLLDPYSPEMKAIGDGREVINMMEVYRQGEVVWRGPGPYR